MRIPFPERVNLSYALIFATTLSLIQILEGTNIAFAGCVFCFILVAAVGFNIAGGVPFPSGAYIGFNALFTVILPMITKLFLREPADSNLHTPMRTIEVYLLGMVAMLAAVIVSRRFRPRNALISGWLPANSLHSAYVGSAVMSVLVELYLQAFPYYGNGTFASFLVQANRFPLLTFVLGTIYTIQRTNGRRSVTLPLLSMILFLSLGAFLTFSKEQFLAPFFAWAIAAGLMRYRLHWANGMFFVVGAYLVVTFLVPYAQVGRQYQETNLSPVELAGYLLSHMDEVKQSYDEGTILVGDIHYYNRNLGLLSRLDVISMDDALIDVTDREGAFGFRPIIEGFENIIPHVLWPNKPVSAFGNLYARDMGILSDEDLTTGISFSPSPDAYHQARMLGVLVLEPVVLIVIFLVLDAVIGDVRRNPVGLLTTILVARAALEYALYGTPLLIGQFLFSNVLAAFFCAYVLPVLGSVFSKLTMGPSGRAAAIPSAQTADSL